MAYQADDPAVRLARRLRSLREDGLAGQRITQRQLSEAIGASGPLISSWESPTNPACPPRERLDVYATFFATERSIARSPFRVLPKAELTSAERVRRDELFQELSDLRDEVRGHGPGSSTDPFANSHWRFPPGEDITIVCSVLPPEYLESIPYADPDTPDHVELYKFADLDALLELFGHLRAANPLSNVRVRPPELKADDYRTHLVLLGGVDWNRITAELLRLLDVPVRQLERETEDVPGGFLVVEGESERLVPPELRMEGGKAVLVADVAHFFRTVNPHDDERTVTICNGMYARGTYGAVRALTDERYRERNERYLQTRFGGTSTFSILTRVQVISGQVVTPDWSSANAVLHEWLKPAM